MTPKVTKESIPAAIQGPFMRVFQGARRLIRVGPAVGALLAAACGRQSRIDDQMKRDLEAASVSTMELSPNGGGQGVVSAIEQLPEGHVRPTTARKNATSTSPTKQPERT